MLGSDFGFGAYDPDVWRAQTVLGEMGFRAGSADGIMGPSTEAGVDAFRSWAEIGPGGIDDAFWNALVTQAAAMGIAIPDPPGASEVTVAASEAAHAAATKVEVAAKEAAKLAPSRTDFLIPMLAMAAGLLLLWRR